MHTIPDMRIIAKHEALDCVNLIIQIAGAIKSDLIEDITPKTNTLQALESNLGQFSRECTKIMLLSVLQ